MGPEEIRLLQASRLALHTAGKPLRGLPGEWASPYVGDGIEFAAVRAFEAGDDLRELDLHTLAHSGDEQLIERVAERQLRVYIWAGAAGAGSGPDRLFRHKPAIAAIAAGLLIVAARNVYSPVGLCCFGRDIDSFAPARSGAGSGAELLQRILERRSDAATGEPAAGRALAFMLERVPAHSLVFFVSDFQDAFFATDFAEHWRTAARRFDLVAVVIRDPLEDGPRLPHAVRIPVTDGAGRPDGEIYLTPPRLAALQAAAAEHLAHLAANFRRAGCAHVVLDTPSVAACERALGQFFATRRQGRG